MLINEKTCFIYIPQTVLEKCDNQSNLLQHKKSHIKHITITKPIKLGNTNYSIVREVIKAPSLKKAKNINQLRITINI